MSQENNRLVLTMWNNQSEFTKNVLQHAGNLFYKKRTKARTPSQKKSHFGPDIFRETRHKLQWNLPFRKYHNGAPSQANYSLMLYKEKPRTHQCMFDSKLWNKHHLGVNIFSYLISRHYTGLVYHAFSLLIDKQSLEMREAIVNYWLILLNSDSTSASRVLIPIDAAQRWAASLSRDLKTEGISLVPKVPCYWATTSWIHRCR